VPGNRHLRWDGCCNIRDLGGLPTEDGGETRFRVVVRADNVTMLSTAGWHALSEYGVRRIVDLRHAEELDEDRPHAAGIEVVHSPTVEDIAVFAEVDRMLAGATDPAEWRRRNYLFILERAAENFARAATAVARVPDGTVLVHCAGGADRTGLLSALVLRLASVPIDAVAADWAESERSWAPTIGEWIYAAPDEDERRKRRLLSVMPAAAMRDVLVELERRHGSTRAYLLAAGAERADLDALRGRLRG
jgi:protein-tyrosine phosphatase